MKKDKLRIRAKYKDDGRGGRFAIRIQLEVNGTVVATLSATDWNKAIANPVPWPDPFPTGGRLISMSHKQKLLEDLREAA